MVSCQHDVQQFNNVSFQAIPLFDFCRFSLQSVPRWCKQTQVEENQLPEVHIPEEDLKNLTPLVTCLYLLGRLPPKLNSSTGIWDRRRFEPETMHF
jgi:hypothetical protein